VNISPKQTSFLFPGQGAQKLGMGHQLAERFAVAAKTFSDADEILQIPLSKIAWFGPEEELNDTLNTQPALFVHSIAALRVFQERYPSFKPAYVAGHSLGELTALVAAEAISFTDGLNLVRRRGELMKQAGEITPGGMAAILGLDIPTLEEICEIASTEEEHVQVANDNCPGQVVISGDIPALDRVFPLAQEVGAKRVVRLEVSIAAHSHRMKNAQDDFSKAISATTLSTPSINIIGNVNAAPLRSSADIELDLEAQLTSRVRWTESMQYLLEHKITHFIEMGPGEVLSGLLKRIDRKTIRFSLGEPEDFEKLEI
jgi:[acyl-carrier-protein] S-malonyltransferase